MHLFPIRGAAIWPAALAVLLVACGEPAPPLHGVVYDPPDPAPATDLRMADGSTFDLKDQRGSVVLVFFGYTYCPDICPTTLADWKRVKALLGKDASRVKFVFVSVDYGRDTGSIAQQYASRFDRDFIGVSGDSAQVAAAQAGFGVHSFREEVNSPVGYLVTHSSQVFAIDPRNRLRTFYALNVSPEDVAADIKRLLTNS